MNDLDWNLIRAFRATADTGSLAAAARQLGLAQPTLSRQVAALEQSLGLTLFERIGRRLMITDAGVGLLEQARAMAAAADELALAAAGRSSEVSGRVCISVTDAFAAVVMPDIVARLRHEAPQITIAILATDSVSDLRRREADIAIRHVKPVEPELIARRIGSLEAGFYVSEAFAAKHDLSRTAADLARLDILGFEPLDRFLGHLAGMGITIPREHCRIVSESSAALWAMLQRGLGVGVMLTSVAERTPGLVRIAREAPCIQVPVWLVTHRELHTSRRVRIVFDTIADDLRDLMRSKGTPASA
jgi:DNA-binding transcriptional LysR family regulator